jgi:small-conductance mechanosensitive channel
MAGIRRINSITEIILVVFAFMVYFAVKAYPGLSTPAYYTVTLLFALRSAVGIAIIVVILFFIDLYGRITKNEREIHEFARIFRLIAYPLLVLLLLQTVGISIAGLLVGAGFLGIIIGLAAQTTLGNVFAGISIIYSNPFKAGDKITLTPLSLGIQAPTHPHETMTTEITGTIKSVGIIYTKLMRDDWSMMYIPNGVLNQGIIQNLSRVNERLVRIRLGVSRDTDVELFKKNLISKLSREKGDYERLRGMEIKTSLISTEQDLGISITARVQILDYDRLSQWLSENAVKVLLDVQKRGKRKK